MGAVTPPVPCQGRNPCAVRGCKCCVPRFGARATRVRVCVCCVARLQPEERKLFAKETQKNPVVKTVLSLLAGELALEREEAADVTRAAAAKASPFLDELPPEIAAEIRKRIASEEA